MFYPAGENRVEGDRMDFLVWPGAGVTGIGLLVLIWCIWQVASAKRAGLQEDAMRARLQKVVIWNMAALGMSAIGLMMVIVGLFL